MTLTFLHEFIDPYLPPTNPYTMHTPTTTTLPYRSLQEEEPTTYVIWEIVYVSLVLLFMLVALLSDRIGADWVMITALTLCMASRIISIDEGLAGFSNEGLITVLVLFVVAAGISHTGALDWYMGKLLGRPKSVASGQIRLMMPIAVISAFLNNTPVVSVMIPIVQRWGKNVGISPKLLLIPLSFSSILGGTCTLIGTSTNLVVYGLLQDRYSTEPITIGLFSLGEYGVPIALIGGAYILIASPFCFENSASTKSGSGGKEGAVVSLDGEDYVLLGARLTKWSSAAGRSVKRSGLRDTGGLYLVSVHRAATGNVHRAVGQDFVLNVEDILYFTGLVEGFGDFCEEHGLEVVTNEVEDTLPEGTVHALHNGGMGDNKGSVGASLTLDVGNGEETTLAIEPALDHYDVNEEEKNVTFTANTQLQSIVEDEEAQDLALNASIVGMTKESLAQTDEAIRIRFINRMTDMIRGIAPSLPEDMGGSTRFNNSIQPNISSSLCLSVEPAQIVVASEHTLNDMNGHPMVIVGVNCIDRPGLLHDISKGLLRLRLQCHHTEASVIGLRSFSIWRCEVLLGRDGMVDVEEIWSVLNALLENESGIQAIKQRGLRVIRAIVLNTSRLIGKTASEANFRDTYKAAIVAVRRGGRNVSETLSNVRFQSGDVLVLQASDESYLLVRPDVEFYSRVAAEGKDQDEGEDGEIKRSNSMQNMMKKMVKKTLGSNTDLPGLLLPSSAKQEQEDKPLPTPTDGTDRMEGEQPLKDSAYYSLTYEHENQDTSEPTESSSTTVAEEKTSIEDDDGDNHDDPETIKAREAVWKDLQVGDTSLQKSAISTPQERDFLVAMQIAPKSQLANKTAVQSGIDKLAGVFLVSIERPKHTNDTNEQLDNQSSFTGSFRSSTNGDFPVSQAVDPVAVDDMLLEGDVLWFSGSAASVGDLRKIPGLKSYENDEVKKLHDKVHERRLVQAIISRKGPLVGKTVKDVKFRTRYGAAIIAVHREGKRVHDHPGQVKLQAGDVLLLEAGPTFLERNADNDRSFALLSEVEDSTPPRLRLLIPALVLTVAMLAVYSAGVVSLLISSLCAAILMVMIGVITQQEARDAINWDVFITIASAYGIGTALVNSGVATGVANGLVSLSEVMGLGDAGLYGVIYLATFLISNIVTNNAAAALIFPIAMDAAEQTGADTTIMAYNIMLAASASFMSPFGYTTNLLIYGPGGYKYLDFVKIGTPMQLVLWILTIFLLGEQLPWWVSWIISAVVFAVVSVATIVGCAPCKAKFSKKENDKTA